MGWSILFLLCLAADTVRAVEVGHTLTGCKLAYDASISV